MRITYSLIHASDQGQPASRCSVPCQAPPSNLITAPTFRGTCPPPWSSGSSDVQATTDHGGVGCHDGDLWITDPLWTTYGPAGGSDRFQRCGAMSLTFLPHECQA